MSFTDSEKLVKKLLFPVLPRKILPNGSMLQQRKQLQKGTNFIMILLLLTLNAVLQNLFDSTRAFLPTFFNSTLENQGVSGKLGQGKTNNHKHDISTTAHHETARLISELIKGLVAANIPLRAADNSHFGQF